MSTAANAAVSFDPDAFMAKRATASPTPSQAAPPAFDPDEFMAKRQAPVDLPGATPLLLSQVKAGKTPNAPTQPTQFEQERNPANQSGVLSNFWESLKSFIPKMQSPYAGMDTDQKAQAAAESGAQDRANMQHRVDQGRSLAYRTMAPVAETVGADVRGMEDAADVGNARAIVGKAAAPIAVAAAPLAAEGAAKVARPITKAVADTAGKAADVAGGTVKNVAERVAQPFGVGVSGESMVKSGIKPRAQAKGWDTAIKTAGDDIVNYHKDSPIKSVKDLEEAVPTIQKKIQNEEIKPVVAKHADEPLAPERMARVKKAVEDTVSPHVEEFDEAGAKDAKELAEKMGKARTVGDIMGGDKGGLLGYINGKLESYFNKYPSARRGDLMRNPDTAAWEAARRSLREETLDHLEEQGEDGIRGARQRWGALNDIGREVERRGNVADRQNPISLSRMLGGVGAIPTHGASLVLGEIMHYLNKPDTLVRRGVEKMANAPRAAVPLTRETIPAMRGQQIPLNMPEGPLFQIRPEQPRLYTQSPAERAGIPLLENPQRPELPPAGGSSAPSVPARPMARQPEVRVERGAGGRMQRVYSSDAREVIGHTAEGGDIVEPRSIEASRKAAGLSVTPSAEGANSSAAKPLSHSETPTRTAKPLSSRATVRAAADKYLQSLGREAPDVEHVAEPKGARGNASGAPGGGGLEEQARMEAEKKTNVKYYREDLGGKRTEIVGLGRQDARAYTPGERVIRVNADGSETILDEKQRARPGAATKTIRQTPQE